MHKRKNSCLWFPIVFGFLIPSISFLFFTEPTGLLKTSDIKKAPKYKDANGISDKAVYFIKNLGKNQMVDIPAGNYAQGVYPICYTTTYNSNQRYIISKEYGDTYRIRPLYSPNMVLGIQNDNASAGNKLQLKNEEYSREKLFSDKFTLTRFGSTSHFYIHTGGGTYTGMSLGLADSSVSNGSQIKQDSADGSNYYLWDFIETDSLEPYCPFSELISSIGQVRYNIRVPYSGGFKINLSTGGRIAIYENSNNTLVGQSTGSTLEYSFSLNGNTDYSALITNINSFQKTYTITLTPLLTSFSYGVFDYDQNNTDMVSPLNTGKSYFGSKGYYPVVYANLNKDRILNADNAGWVPLNSKYVTINAHGNKGTVWAYNGPDCDDSNAFFASSLPIMSNVSLASWFTCNSASNTEGGYITNMARESVVKGAQYSLGFKGDIRTNCANTFSKNIARAVSENQTGLEIIRNALSYTRSEEWIFSQLLPYSLESLWTPYCYYRNAGNQIVYSIPNTQNPTAYPDDCVSLNSPSGSLTELGKQENDLTSDSDDYLSIDYFGKEISLAKFGDVYSNIIYDDKSYSALCQSVSSLLADFSSTSSQGIKLIFKVNGQYEAFFVESTYSGDTIGTKYWNLTDEEEISQGEFNQYSNSFAQV
jgi:hypothetical protein